MWRMFMSSSMKAAHSSWTELYDEPGNLQEHELRGNSELIQYHTEIDIGVNWIDFWMYKRFALQHLSILDEISIDLVIKWSSEQRQKYLSTLIPYFAWERWMKAKMQF